MHAPSHHDLFQALLKANLIAETTSAEWNDRAKELEEGASLSADGRRLGGIIRKQYIESVKDDDKKLKQLFGKQQFWSSEVVRLSSMLQAYTAYQQMNPLWHPDM